MKLIELKANPKDKFYIGTKEFYVRQDVSHINYGVDLIKTASGYEHKSGYRVKPYKDGYLFFADDKEELKQQVSDYFGFEVKFEHTLS